MALSERVDLTQNRDFHRGGTWTPDAALMADDINEIMGLSTQNAMSIDEYDKLVRFEILFGKKWHYSMYREIFRKSDEVYYNEMRDHCQRCGKSLRIPWKRRYDLCIECDKHMEREKGFPWYPEVRAVLGDRTRDIFRLR